MHIAADWDGTVVDPKTQAWLPARDGDVAPLDALKRLIRDGHRVIIHSCRANWPEGLASIEAKLDAEGLLGLSKCNVWAWPGKPHADVYADDLSFPPFEGRWRALLAHVAKTTPVPRHPLRGKQPVNVRRYSETVTFPKWPSR